MKRLEVKRVAIKITLEEEASKIVHICTTSCLGRKNKRKFLREFRGLLQGILKGEKNITKGGLNGRVAKEVSRYGDVREC